MATILYLGTKEGFFAVKSENRRSWQIESRALHDWEVSKIAVSPFRPDRLEGLVAA